MKDLKVTLYDLFGYFLPGIFFLAALVVSVWALFLRDSAVFRGFDLSVGGGAIVIIAAYIAGHLAHGLGNIVERLIVRKAHRLKKDVLLTIPASVMKAARDKLKEVTGISEEDDYSLYEIADEFVVQQGSRENREIYIYREGFYRGMAVAFAALAVAIGLQWLLANQTSIIVASTIFFVSNKGFGFTVCLLVIAAGFMYGRERHFRYYRVKAAIIGFIALPREKKPSPGEPATA